MGGWGLYDVLETSLEHELGALNHYSAGWAGAQGARGAEKLRPVRGRGAQQKSWGRAFAKPTMILVLGYGTSNMVSSTGVH